MAETKAETFYAFVGMVTNPAKIFIKFVGCENENGNSTMICDSAKTFVEEIPKLFTSKYKAVIFYVSELQSPDFENSIEFCKAVKAQMNMIQIPHYFVNTLDYIASGMLIKFNISLKLQGIVLLVIAGENVALVNEFQFTENGYENIRFDDVVINDKENLQSIRDKIYGSSKPQKILIVYKNNGKSTADFLRKNIIKSKNVFMSDADFGSSSDKFVVEWSKWLLDKSNTKYYVIPRCGKMFCLFAQFERIPLITVTVTEKVPLEKSAYVSKVNGYVMLTYDKFLKQPEYACSLKMKDDCHRMKIAMTVDAESFPTLDYDLFEIHKVTQLPETLNKKVSKKVPFIGFYDDCSVICVFNEKENRYKFLDAWNGKYGKALVMSFDSAKPLFCSDVCRNTKLKRTSIVYDLIKIMSMAEDNIQTDKRWPFVVTKNEKDSVLIEYENWKGERKTATPTFLMALLLKEHLNAIKNETGESYAEFGFYCFHDFTEDEKMNVVKQLRQSFNLMKLECTIGIFPDCH